MIIPCFHNYTKRTVSSAPLAVFRIAFGLLMMISLVRFMIYGWVDKFYIQPSFHFKYYGFSWVQTWGEYTYLLFIFGILACVGIILGYRYRLSMALFFLSFTYIELIDKTTYLNHYYFISLLSFVLIFLPLNARFSLDANRNGSYFSQVPQWTIDIIKICLGIVYFYAGLSKLNSDWLFRAQPLKIWLSNQLDIPFIGHWFRESWFHFTMSWAGAIYDLIIPFALLYRKTRPIAFVAVVVFHLLTRYWFSIGMFPYIMIISSTIFFSPIFHRKILSYLVHLFKIKPNIRSVAFPNYRLKWVKKGLLILILIQLTFPFRYIFYPNELLWSEEGFRFSWRVMLIEKGADTHFTVIDKISGKAIYVNNSEFLTPLQEKQMSSQADFILEYAHYLGAYFKNKGMKQPQVFVESMVSLNGRKAQRYIDPTVDLMTQEEGWHSKTWINPFEDEIKGI